MLSAGLGIRLSDASYHFDQTSFSTQDPIPGNIIISSPNSQPAHDNTDDLALAATANTAQRHLKIFKVLNYRTGLI